MEKYEKYSFKKYNKNFVQLFNNERYKLKKIFPKAEIEHVGSSSVPNLGGKGIIDIALSVSKKDILKAVSKLQRNGFEYKNYTGNKERKFFEKIIRYSGNERRVHIQLTYTDSKTWKSMVSIREYLKKHNKVAKKYVQVKRVAFKSAKGDGKKYREYKKKFLDKIVKKAFKECPC